MHFFLKRGIVLLDDRRIVGISVGNASVKLLTPDSSLLWKKKKLTGDIETGC